MFLWPGRMTWCFLLHECLVDPFRSRNSTPHHVYWFGNRGFSSQISRDERVQLNSIVWILIEVKNSARGTKSNTNFQQKVIPPFVRFVIPVQEQRYVFSRPLRVCVPRPTSLVILPITREPATVTPIDDRQDAGGTPFRGGGYHDVAPVEVSTRENYVCIVA